MILRRWLPLLLLLSYLVAGSSGCSKTPAEEAILKNIEYMQQAAENREPRNAVRFVDEDFVGNRGIDKMGLRGVVAAALFRHAKIGITITSIKIEVDPVDPYVANMNCVAVFTGAESLLPQDGRIYKITGEWYHKGGDWLLVRASWE